MSHYNDVRSKFVKLIFKLIIKKKTCVIFSGYIEKQSKERPYSVFLYYPVIFENFEAFIIFDPITTTSYLPTGNPQTVRPTYEVAPPGCMAIPVMGIICGSASADLLP